MVLYAGKEIGRLLASVLEDSIQLEILQEQEGQIWAIFSSNLCVTMGPKPLRGCILVQIPGIGKVKATIPIHGFLVKVFLTLNR